MRLSTLFSRTLRAAPADADLPSHALLTRAGMIRQLASGIYAYLPLGWEVIRQLRGIMCEELNAVGGQEMHMPLVTPAELWQASGRWYEIGDELVRLRDRADREMVLAMTHEETITEVARFLIQSYRGLPLMVYQFSTKVRDEPRPRGGLIRLREFLMQDAYSLHASADDLDRFFEHMRRAYARIFHRVGLQPLVIDALNGLMGGVESIEFSLPHPLGDDNFVECADCDYAANLEVAVADRGAPPTDAPRPLALIPTPGANTIADLAALLDTSEETILKSVWYTIEGETPLRLVVALIRGDLEVDERRLVEAIGRRAIRPSTPAEMGQVGAVAGYASVIGIDRAPTADNPARLVVVADDTVPVTPNLIAGANQADMHYLNSNYGRDFTADIVTNIAMVCEGDCCPRCGAPLKLRRSMELAQLFKIGSRYSESMGAAVLDSSGQPMPLIMGSYGIGLDRLLAAIVEVHHDSRGITWPENVAPADLHLIALKAEDPAVREMAEGLYNDLRIAGYRVLYDDRPESAGVKFADADLIGVPLRLTVSPRTLKQNAVEVKPRLKEASEVVALDDLYAWIEAWKHE